MPDVAAVAAFAEAKPAAVGGADPSASITDQVSSRAAFVARDVALSLGAVRKARHVIAGTIGTWRLGLWEGGSPARDADKRAPWLDQPEADQTLQWSLTHTVDDLLWHDRSVWRITNRTVYGGNPATFERIHPSRVDAVRDSRDPDRVDTWLIDGREVRSNLVIFDGAGLGGLQRYGAALLDLYGKLQAAAGRYADAPHPHAILKNHGADLTDEEIESLLAAWEAARAKRSVAYLNDVVDYEAQGWNAKDLELTEAREQAALEVARLFGLPAVALDAKTGDTMTYANVVDRRRDLVDALEPWTTVIEQTLSMVDRAGTPRGLVVPRGLSVRFDTTEYTRPGPKERATTWMELIQSGVITPEEARTLDPLTKGL